MRKSVVAAWLALSSIILAVPASADGPISLPPLAPGEVLLELDPVGVATLPATSATIMVSIYVEGETDEEARRIADIALAQVRAAGRAAGIAETDIETELADGASDVLMNASYVDLNAVGLQAGYAGASAVIRVRNPAAAPALQRTLRGLPNVRSAAPEYRLDDDSAARRAARADAMRRARADADAYAASMNMRVARVLRVTERVESDVLSAMALENPFMRGLEGGRADEGQVRTVAALGVDYALSPR